MTLVYFIDLQFGSEKRWQEMVGGKSSGAGGFSAFSLDFSPTWKQRGQCVSLQTLLTPFSSSHHRWPTRFSKSSVGVWEAPGLHVGSSVCRMGAPEATVSVKHVVKDNADNGRQ